MTSPPITVLLDAARSGDIAATNTLFTAVYVELQKLARSHRRRWQGNATLNTTALVHEAYAKLAAAGSNEYANRTHFFATASKAMRQVLVNYAEAQGAAKRGGEAIKVPLEEVSLASEVSADEVLDLHRALAALEQENPRRGQIVECRIFGGMSIEEIADALSISPATVKRDWQIASALLFEALKAPAP